MVNGPENVTPKAFTSGVEVKGTVSINPQVVSTPIKMSTADAGVYLADIDTIKDKKKTTSPESQGLASADKVLNGELTSGYHFDTIDIDADAATFALKYNTADAKRIGTSTNSACEGIEYAQVAGHLQTKKNNPYVGLYTNAG